MDVLNVLNSILWVASNVFLAYTSVVLIIFLVAYVIIFDPRATTGGKLIFQFMFSLACIVGLVFIGIFVDPASNSHWTYLPESVDPWRPILRFGVYGFTAYSITSLMVLLIMRKWFPHRLKKASDLVLVQPRHTSEIPIVKNLPIKAKTSMGPAGNSREN
jgi:hypothetical protein